MLEEYILLEDEKFPAKQSKRAVVVVGRFQPPHCGHNLIIGKAKSEFKDGKYDAVFVVVIAGKKSSEDTATNPLDPEERIKYLSHLKNASNVKFLVATDAVGAFVKVREAGYEPIAIVGGKLGKEDRAQSYKNGILDKYFKNADGSPIEHKAISVERDSSDGGVAGVSGTIVRTSVAADRLDDFEDWTCMDNEKITKSMYTAVKAKMGYGDK